MADVTANGVRFHVQRLTSPAAAPTVVFVHGLLIDDLSSFYFPVAHPLASAGADAILYDLRGHGRSERPRAGYAVSDSVADLAALLDALDVRAPVHLVGNSYGGTVALGLALAHPERVASLVLIEAHVPDDGWGRQMEATLARVGRQVAVGSLTGRARARAGARVTALLSGTTLASDLRAVTAFRRGALRALTCPVRAVYGGDSDALRYARELEDLLPQLRLTVLPGCSHWLLRDAQSSVRDAVLDWFAVGPVVA